MVFARPAERGTLFSLACPLFLAKRSEECIDAQTVYNANTAPFSGRGNRHTFDLSFAQEDEQLRAAESAVGDGSGHTQPARLDPCGIRNNFFGKHSLESTRHVLPNFRRAYRAGPK